MNADNDNPIPSTANVDHYSREFEQGMADGKAGRPCVIEHPKHSQAWFNYREGWLMGESELGSLPDGFES
jgi:hypothetical protein